MVPDPLGLSVTVKEEPAFDENSGYMPKEEKCVPA